MGSRPKKRRPGWLRRRLLMIFLGLCLGWLLAEALLRMAFPTLPYPVQVTLRHVHKTPFRADELILPPQIWQDDGDFQFISRPNIDHALQYPDPRVGFYVTTKNWLNPDSHVGFRVPSLEWEPRWPVDLLVVGDSFTFCYTEYAACWVQQLAAQYGLSVVNLGQVATGTRSHLHILQTFGLPYEPQMVVWQWYGNDFNDDYGFARDRGEIDPIGDTAPAYIPEPRSPVGQWLFDYAAVFRLLYLAVNAPDQPPGSIRFDDPYQVRDEAFSFAYGRSYNYASTDLTDPQNQLGEAISHQTLLEAQALLDERGIAWIILLIPAKEEVYARWVEPVLGEAYIDSLAEGRHRMMAFCEAENLTCLDVTPQLVAFAEQGELLYWERDTHLNEAGNRRLAEIVYEFLLAQEDFLPQ